MAQVGVQQPTNLMEMFSSPSMMLGDIAAQQVNDQTLGNLLNRQQAAQSMDIEKQKLPFELQQLGLQNQETQARIPGVTADSGLKQNNLKVSNATLPDQIKAKLSDLAKTVSDNDLTQAENQVKMLMTSPDPKIRASVKPLFDSLYEIRKERDKLSIQGGNAIALEKERGVQQRQLETQQYEHGKYLKPATMSIMQRINTFTKPNELDAALRQILADDGLKAEDRSRYEAKFRANIPAYNAWASLQQNAKGAVDPSAVTGMPGVQPPTAQPAPGATPQEAQPAAPDQISLKGSFASEADAESALRAGKIKPGDIVIINGRKAKVR